MLWNLIMFSKIHKFSVFNLFSLQRWWSHLGNKRYLATGWSRGRFGNGWRMKCREVTIWQGNKWKERRTQLSLFFILTQDPSYVWLLWSLQEAPESHQQYFVQLIYQTNGKQLFQSTKMTIKKLRKCKSQHFFLMNFAQCCRVLYE